MKKIKKHKWIIIISVIAFFYWFYFSETAIVKRCSDHGRYSQESHIFKKCLLSHGIRY